MQTKPNRREQKKFRWDLLLLFSVLFALIILIILFYPKKIDEEQAEYPKTILTIDDIESIDVNIDGKHAYTLINKGNTLYLNGVTPLNLDKQEIVYRITKNIIAEESINTDNLELRDIGLDSAHLSLDIKHSSDKSTRLYIGNKLPLSDNYYAKFADKEQVYALNNGYEDLFNINPQFLLDRENIGIYRNLIKSISIRNQNDSFLIKLRDYESKSLYGYIASPIIYPADKDKVNTIVNELINIDLALSLGEDTGDYGFDSENAVEIVIEQYAGQGENISVPQSSKKIILGAEDGFYIYALYDNCVYKISSIAMQSIINLNLDSLISKKIFNLSIGDIDKLISIKDKMADNTTLYSITHDSVGELIIYKDNKEFDTDAFVDNIKNLISLELEGISGQLDTSNLKLLRSIEFVQSDRSQTISFFEKDEYNAYVSIDGVCLGYCIKQSLNQILFVN